MSSDFWQARRVFITGHTGFRGSHLALTLKSAGANVFGFSLSPSTNPNFFEVANVGQGMNSTFGDVRDVAALKAALEYSQAEVVFHLAGGGGLRESWDKVAETYSSQVMGTVNLLECLRDTATVRSVVMLSSDKVYRPLPGHAAIEEDPLAGSAPAATGKACADLILESYLQSVFAPEKYNKHKIALATARMGSVVGGGDFSTDSLIWQLAQATQSGLDLPLKNPESIRPWMHVDDAVNALMVLAQALLDRGPRASGAWNFGVGADHQLSVGAAVQFFKAKFENKKADDFKLSSNGSVHGLLNSDKSHSQLGWQPKLSAEQALSQAAEWYRSYFGELRW